MTNQPVLSDDELNARNEIGESAEPVFSNVVQKPAPAAGSSAKRHLPEGVVLLAVYHFLMALPGLLIGLIILAIPIPAVVMTVDEPVGLTAALVALSILALLIGGSGLLYLLTGFGLLRRWNWTRWLAIALGLSMTLCVPVGTLIGAVVIIYLLSEDVRRFFVS